MPTRGHRPSTVASGGSVKNSGEVHLQQVEPFAVEHALHVAPEMGPDGEMRDGAIAEHLRAVPDAPPSGCRSARLSGSRWPAAPAVTIVTLCPRATSSVAV